MKKLLFLFFILGILYSIKSLAQTHQVDSLTNALNLHLEKDTIRVHLLLEIGEEMYKKNTVKAIDFGQEALDVSEIISYDFGKANALSLIGICHSNDHDYKKAIEYLENSSGLYDDLNETKKYAKNLFNLGLFHSKLNENDEAYNYYKKALVIFEQLESNSDISNCLNSLGVISNKRGNYPQALEYFESLLKIVEESGESHQHSSSLNNMGVSYLFQGNYPLALEYFQRSLQIAEKADNKPIIFTSLMNIGIVYKKQENIEKALILYQESIEIAQEIDDQLGIKKCYVNIGIIYATQKDYSKALEYFNKSLAIVELLNDEYEIALSLNNIGNLYIDLGEYVFAKKHLNRSLEIRRRIHDKEGLSSTYLNLGSNELKIGNYTKAEEYSLIGLKIALEFNLRYYQKELYFQLSEIYNVSRDYKKAFINYKLFSTLNDSIFSKKNIQDITRLELQYKYEKEKELLELKQQKKDAITKREIKYHKASKNVFIIGFFIALLIILMSVYIILNKRKVNRELEAKNEEIGQQNETILLQNEELETHTEELQQHKNHLREEVYERTKELTKAKEKAEESNNLKTSFLNNISHEFRTPMNGIIGFSSLLTHAETEEEHEEYTDIIKQSCDRLLNLVNDTVEISKVHSGQAKLIKSDVNISEIIQNILIEFEESALLKEIEIETQLDAEIERLIIRNDLDKITRIFWHIINNAIKFTQGGFIKISGSVIRQDKLQFKIEDSGIGMTKEIQAKIFDYFIQAEMGNARTYEGNGIGLSLSKTYIEMLDGEIWIESQINKGASIYFNFPFVLGGKSQSKKLETASGNLENKIILIAEDNEMNYLLLKRMLAHQQLCFLHAWNGQGAVEIFKNEKHIDLVLMDLKMPIMGGYEALRRIREMNAETPIIAQTAYAHETDIERIKAVGFNAYITKPILKEKLIRLLKLWV
ncbi:MAG: tetratricopeptide repeat protein [Bacteroidales bacterium]|nr:tetratricopeptide repeat protein [Bacteroidales bacterium]